MWPLKNKFTQLALCIIVFGIALDAWSDFKPYSGEVHISDEGKEIIITHIHSRRYGRQWYEDQIESFSDCDYRLNTQGVLQVFQKSKRLFCSVVPALTLVWLSPDEQYIVGLSDIKWLNSYQIVVYSITGDLLFRRPIRCEEVNIGGCAESVTNYVHWFDKKSPEILIKEIGNQTIELSLNSPDGSRIFFIFPMKPARPLDNTPCGKNWGKMSAEAYWLYHVNGKITVESQKGGFICLSVRESIGDNYRYIDRDALSNRRAKEEIFLMILDAAHGYITDDNMTPETFAQLKLWLNRIAGINCETKDQCIDWLIQHQTVMTLSDDGKYLVEKNEDTVGK